MAGAEGESIQELSERMDQIVSQVRGKQTSLEESLDLLDEAIRLGTRAVELVDTARPSAQELKAASAEFDAGAHESDAEARESDDDAPGLNGTRQSDGTAADGADQEGE